MSLAVPAPRPHPCLALLDAGVPLTLLLDLGAGPRLDSRSLLLDEAPEAALGTAVAPTGAANRPARTG